MLLVSANSLHHGRDGYDYHLFSTAPEEFIAGQNDYI